MHVSQNSFEILNFISKQGSSDFVLLKHDYTSSLPVQNQTPTHVTANTYQMKLLFQTNKKGGF